MAGNWAGIFHTRLVKIRHFSKCIHTISIYPALEGLGFRIFEFKVLGFRV